jgi:hypothetical protein
MMSEDAEYIYTDDGKPGHDLCASCKHWHVSHSAFSGCVIMVGENRDNHCFCSEFAPQEVAGPA